MYVGMILLQIGVVMVCFSWLYLFLAVALMVLLNATSLAEERYCLYLYSDDYQKYKNSTRGWIGILKSKKE